MKIKSILFVLVVSLFFSCKKKETTSTSSTGNGGGTTNGTTTGNPSNATSFSGFLVTGNYTTSYGSGMSGTYSNARAFFSSQPIQFQNGKGIKVQKVFLNADSLTFYDALGYYIPTNSPTLTGVTWSVTGAGIIPSFTYTNTTTLPKIELQAPLPDSISKSAGFNITINNLSNMNSGSILLYDGVSTTGGIVTFLLKPGFNSVDFNPASLTSLATGTTGFISVYVENSQVLNFSGRDLKFTNEAQNQHTVKIKP